MLPLKLGLLLFWAAWFGIVAATNLFSALKAAGRLPPSWKFASKNYEAVAKAVSLYSPPPWLAHALLAGVIIWQVAACALFGAAFLASIRAHAVAWSVVSPALFLGA